jgi:hypothetical protein
MDRVEIGDRAVGIARNKEIYGVIAAGYVHWILGLMIQQGDMVAEASFAILHKDDSTRYPGILPVLFPDDPSSKKMDFSALFAFGLLDKAKERARSPFQKANLIEWMVLQAKVYYYAFRGNLPLATEWYNLETRINYLEQSLLCSQIALKYYESQDTEKASNVECFIEAVQRALDEKRRSGVVLGL